MSWIYDWFPNVWYNHELNSLPISGLHRAVCDIIHIGAGLPNNLQIKSGELSAQDRRTPCTLNETTFWFDDHVASRVHAI